CVSGPRFLARGPSISGWRRRGAARRAVLERDPKAEARAGASAKLGRYTRAPPRQPVMSRFGINQRIADRLLADRLIREPEHQRVVDLASKKGVRVEEVLLDLKLIEEPKLLKYIATVHKTQFVS